MTILILNSMARARTARDQVDKTEERRRNTVEAMEIPRKVRERIAARI